MSKFEQLTRELNRLKITTRQLFDNNLIHLVENETTKTLKGYKLSEYRSQILEDYFYPIFGTIKLVDEYSTGSSWDDNEVLTKIYHFSKFDIFVKIAYGSSSYTEGALHDFCEVKPIKVEIIKYEDV